MLGDASDFTPLDLLGSLGLNAAATHFACQDGSLRTGIKIGKGGADGKGQVEPYTDTRFLGGLVAAVAAQFGPPMARRVGHDVATGLLGSFIATETCRKAAEDKYNKDQTRLTISPDYQGKQIPAAPPAAPAAAPAGTSKNMHMRGRGSMNSSYGW